jgi:VWFA-related protein
MSFRKITILLSILALAVVTGNAQSRRVVPRPTPPPAEDEAEKVYTEEIKLNVLAFDKAGNFFPEVTANDLVITENDIIHQPSSVRRIPASVLIVMDTGGEMRSVKNLDLTRRTAAALVESLKKGDSMALLEYSDKAEFVSEWTTDKDQMMAAIRRTNFGRRSALVDAISKARDFLSRETVGNKHLVLITDGTDSATTADRKNTVLRSLLATDISVHVISYTRMEAVDIEPRTKGISNSPPPKAMPDEAAARLPNGVRDVATAPKFKTINVDRTMLRKLKARKADLESSEKTLESIAENSNGEFVLPDSVDEMVEKAPLVAKMIDASYVVTYIPKEPLKGGRGRRERNIEVTSKREGLIVQARRKLIYEGK